MNPKLVSEEFIQAETRPRIMVVDDNSDLLNVVREMFIRITHASVECFPSPIEALASFQAAAWKYAFVVTDFEMPGMTGAELCRHLREISPGLKVLLATGSGIASHSAAAAMGFCGLLRKPFMIRDVEKALADAGIVENQAADDLTRES